MIKTFWRALAFLSAFMVAMGGVTAGVTVLAMYEYTVCGDIGVWVVLGGFFLVAIVVVAALIAWSEHR